MIEFRIKWQQCPFKEHLPKVLFVEAIDAETAEAVAKDHIERTTGIEWFRIQEVKSYVRPTGGVVKG